MAFGSVLDDFQWEELLGQTKTRLVVTDFASNWLSRWRVFFFQPITERCKAESLNSGSAETRSHFSSKEKNFC